MHAHVINLTVVLLFLLVLLSLFSRAATIVQQEKPSRHHATSFISWIVELKNALAHPEIWALGCCLAIFMMQNYWDFIIYFPVAAVVVIFASYLEIRQVEANHFLPRVLRQSSIQLLLLMILAYLLTRPFLARFEPMSSEIALAEFHTPLWQWLVLWGPHLLAGGLGCLAMVASRKARRDFRLADVLAMGLFLYGLVLVLVPELFYVVDIYAGEYKRANTMFKFTYKAFVLLGLSWSYFLVRLAFTRSRRQLASLVLAMMLVIPGWFSAPAMKQWYGEKTIANQQGLDGIAPIGKKNSPQVAGDEPGELADDLLAIAWLNTHVQGQPVVLEAAGASYSDASRISTFTGLPTVIGWETHEWLWRTSQANPNAYGDLVKPRQEDVKLIYTTQDQDMRRNLLAKYQVGYLVLGSIERTSYGDQIREDLLLECGEIVFSTPSLQIFLIPAAGS